MSISRIIIFLGALLLCLAASAEDPVLAQLFADQSIEGTIVIKSPQSGETFIHNEARAGQRFSPASTFKVMNTLIFLEEDTIAGKDDTFRWNGRTYSMPAWNRDQTLTSAFQLSCVWCYQSLAKRVSTSTFRDYLQAFHYGQLSEPFERSTFWMDDALKISAIEQVEFLQRVHARSSPFSPTSYDTLREIMLVEETPDYALWAKSGWTEDLQPQIGWYVGYLETADAVWFFATNSEISNQVDLALQQSLTQAALQVKGIIQ